MRRQRLQISHANPQCRKSRKLLTCLLELCLPASCFSDAGTPVVTCVAMTDTTQPNEFMNICYVFIGVPLWTRHVSCSYRGVQLHRGAQITVVMLPVTVYIYFPVASNIWGSSVWDLLRVTFLASRILRWLLYFWKNLCTPVVASRMGGPVEGTRRLMEHVVRPRVYLQHIKNDSQHSLWIMTFLRASYSRTFACYWPRVFRQHQQDWTYRINMDILACQLTCRAV